MFPKQKRTQSKDVLEKYKNKPCCVCGRYPSDIDHIGTRGAGHGDEDFNLWNLCRRHHIEKHAIGLLGFTRKHSVAKDILSKKGWKYEDTLKRWYRDLG